ncbi:MAG: isochorismatase family protein [Selenomonadaceae bacterium]|nr:isochorismatase family protein [Selenomonadaceae bacterium]
MASRDVYECESSAMAGSDVYECETSEIAGSNAYEYETSGMVGSNDSENQASNMAGGSLAGNDAYKCENDGLRDVIDEIELIGVCTDICVISNALLLKTFFPEVTIKVDAACCAGINHESHEMALKAMQMCQIEIYNSDF